MFEVGSLGWCCPVGVVIVGLSFVARGTKLVDLGGAACWVLVCSGHLTAALI